MIPSNQTGYAKKIILSILLPFLLFVIFILLFLSKFFWINHLHNYKIVFFDYFLEKFLEIGIWVCGALFLDRSIRTLFFEGFIKRTLGRAVPDILKTIVSIIILFSLGLGILSMVFDKQITGVWATSGVAGIVLGIALRPLISDIFSGLASNIEGAFKLGEWINIDAGNIAKEMYNGWVEEIRWRTTRIRTRDGNIVIIPNGMLASSIITNYALPMSCSRSSVSIVIHAQIPISKVKRVLDAALLSIIDNQEGPIELPSPEVKIQKINELGIEYILFFWIDRSKHSIYIVQDKVLHTAHEHLSKAGIHQAHNHQDVFLYPSELKSLPQEQSAHRLNFVQSIELFNSLNKDNLEYLSNNMYQHYYPKGHALVIAGQKGESMFILAEGLLEVITKEEEPTPIRLGIIHPGEFFGEMSLLTGVPRSATVRAMTDSIVYEITKDLIKTLITQNPSITEILSHAISQRQIKNTHTLANIHQHTQEHTPDHQHIFDKIKRFFNL